MTAQVSLYIQVGLALRSRNDLGRALKLQQLATELAPNHPETWINLGVAHQDLNQVGKAINVFERACNLANEQLPDEAAHIPQLNLTLAKFRLGPTHTLFKDFLVRWKIKGWPQQPYAIPIPHYLTAHEKSFHHLVILSDQGYGDYLMMLPMVAWLAKQYPRQITLVTKKPLLKFSKAALQGLPLEITDTFVGQASGWLTGMDIPGVFPDALAAYEIERLHIQKTLRTHYRENSNIITAPHHHVLAVCWRGNPDYSLNAWRSTDLSSLLERVKKAKVACHLVTTPSNLTPVEVDALNATHLPWTGPQADFSDTAAYLMHAKSCWTSDTATAHLAGLCGVPTHLAVSLAGDWRWPTHSGPSFWYPSVKVHRQTTLLDWSDYYASFTKYLKSI